MNIAIIGCGAIANTRHAPGVAGHPGAALYAVCDPVRENADRLAGAYGTKAVYRVEEVLEDPAVDAVIVCTPERFHCANVTAALEAGKDVLCEKPLAMTLQEGQAMLDAARRSGRLLMVAFGQRLSPGHQMAKRLLEEGAIGKPLAFRTVLAHRGAEFSTIEGASPDFYDKKLSGIGDVMLSVGCHRMDLIPYLLGGAVSAVSAWLPTLSKTYADGRPIAAADHGMLTLELDNGVTGTAWISWCDYGQPERETVVYGSEGVLTVYRGPELTIDRGDGRTERRPVPPEPGEWQLPTRHFIDVLAGAATPVCTGLDGMACLAVLEAARRSHALGGQRVALSRMWTGPDRIPAPIHRG